MNTNRVERLLKIIQALHSGRAYTATDLAKLAGISRRTVFRDIQLLTRSGIEYSFDRNSGCYSVRGAAMLPPISLTHAEALTLLVATRHGLVSRFAPDRAAALSVGLKVESLLPDVLRNSCGPLLDGIEVRPAQTSDPESVADPIATLQEALVQWTTVRIRYDSYFDRKIIGLILHPYRLVFIHRGWYVIGLSELHKTVRTFKVERILQISRLETKYQVPRNFRLDDYFGNAWLMIREGERHHVRIKFAETVAANVDEVHWHKTQRTRFLDDGSLLFEVDVDGLKEITWWILGYGDQAEVLEPQALRESIASHARHLCTLYDGTKPSHDQRQPTGRKPAPLLRSELHQCEQ